MLLPDAVSEKNGSNGGHRSHLLSDSTHRGSEAEFDGSWARRDAHLRANVWSSTNPASNQREQRRQPMLQLCPPSTGSMTPVMNLESSEARKTAAAATSQAVPILPIGTIALRAATISSTEEYWLEICW